jgi:hypothetical protein
MRSIRRLASILWLALALLVGQHAAALHDLGHVTGHPTHKQDPNKAPGTCDQGVAFAQLSGAVGASPPLLVPPEGEPVQAARGLASVADSPLRLAFRSRAPPVSPV